MEPFLVVRQQSASYPVWVGPGLLDRVGELVRTSGSVFVITAPALRETLADRVAASFDPPARVIAIEDGEARKTMETANEIVTQLLDAGAKRDATAVVVGGGMLGDTAGFAASIFLRGIDLVHVPTTLLAQVDSSIGGKLAVNHPRGKNLVGSFHPPVAVISDVSVLHSLPGRELMSGVFEALKSGVLADPALFEMIETAAARSEPHAALLKLAGDLVRRAVKVKAEIVAADEREEDLRRLLNYGHTIGHGIEAALGYEGITHGEAVGWGMIAANAIAVRRSILDSPTAARIDRAVASLLRDPLPDVDPEAIVHATGHDKKNRGRERVMILPARIGRCEIVTDISEDEVRAGVAAIVQV